MRYFKYKHSSVTEKNALKAQYMEFTKSEKRIVRKEKTLNIIATIVFFAVIIVCCCACVLALKQIPISQYLFLAIMECIGIGILGFVAILSSFILGGLISLPIWNKVNTHHRVMSRDVLSRACAHLREYYGLQEPCIVTKCYKSSDERFNMHDVCIFFVDDELRITTNLKYGFFHSKNDLGCYAFRLDEISLAKSQDEKILIAELKSGEVVFLLGYRAKAFIEKNFNVKSSEA